MSRTNIRSNVIACLEMASADYHQFETGEQVKRPGEKAKIIAAGRTLSRSILGRLLNALTTDTLPLAGGKPTMRTLSYGGEAIILASDDLLNPRHVMKIYHGHFSAKDYQKHGQVLNKYLGSQLEPQLLFTFESPYAPGQLAVGAIQRRIMGDDFFDDPLKARPEEVAKLWEGTEQMLHDTGWIPDYIGHRNVLVDRHGGIHQVDHGVTTFKNDVERQKGGEMMDRLHQAYAQVLS